MNNFLKYWFLFLLIFFSSGYLLKAQTNNLYPESYETKIQHLIGESYLDQSFTHKGIHLFENFLPGRIEFYSSVVVDSIKLRYNSYLDEIIWLNDLYGQVKLDKSIIQNFEILYDGNKIKFVQLRLSVDSISHFYQIYHEGKIKILVQRKVRHSTDYIKNKIHFFLYKPIPQYYITLDNKVILLKKANFKSLYFAFPDIQHKIHSKVRELKLKDNSESDFLNSVISLEEILLESSTPASQ